MSGRPQRHHVRTTGCQHYADLHRGSGDSASGNGVSANLELCDAVHVHEFLYSLHVSGFWKRRAGLVRVCIFQLS